MINNDIKDQLIHATVDLLSESNNVSKITARQIAAEAGTTLGMINYYFDSKDALIDKAVNVLIADRAVELKKIEEKDIPAKEKLIEFLIKMSEITIDFAQFTKPNIPYAMLEREIEEPYHILPMIKEYYGNKKTETECRIISYQLTSYSQLVFYRSEDFKKYSGIDMMDKKQRDQFLQTLVGFLEKDKEEE